MCNRAHQRLILSAAIQPATHQVAREESKGRSAAPIPALSIHTPSTCHPSLRDRDQCQVNSIGTDTVLPNKVLPRAGLLSIASAVAAGLTKAGAAAAASSSRLATAQQPVHGSHGHSQRPNSCKPFSAIATVAGAAAPAVCRRPLGAAATSRGGVGPVRGAHCIARGTAPAAKAVVATATDTCTTAGVVAATAGRGVTTSAGAQARDKAPGAAGARAVATAVKAAVALVPLTKTEEAHQLAMALSASMSAGEVTIQPSGCWAAVS